MRQRSRSFTLVEMMLALALTGILTAVVGSVTVQSFRMTTAAQDHSQVRWEWVSLFDVFELDARGLMADVDHLKPIVINQDEELLLKMLSVTTVPDGESIFRRYMPVWVTYSVRNDPDRSGHKLLIRTVVDLTVRQAEPTRRVVARRLVDVRIEHCVGDKGWSTDRFQPHKGVTIPKAIRLLCRWHDG